MTLDDLLHALRRHRLPAALVFLFVAAATVVGAIMPADQYSATTTVIAEPAQATDVAAFSAAVQVLVPTLTAYVDSRVNDDLVRGSLPPDLATAAVTVKAKAEPGVGLLYITATSTRRDAVARFANASAFALREKQASSFAGVRLRVLDQAITPLAPSGPPRPAILLGGLVLAAFAGLLTALLLRALAARAELADVLFQRTGVRVLAEVPRLRRAARRDLEPLALARGDTDPRLTEALQRLRVALDDSSVGARSLAVTSLHPSEGKSSVTAALAWSMAAAGYGVVVVDADLRRPTQHEHFDVPLEPGLSDVGRTPVGQLTRATLEPSLEVLPAGLPQRHPLEVLDAHLPAVLSELGPSVPVIVVDTPPLGSVAETQRILGLVGAVVVVVNAPRANVDEIDKALGRLRAADIDVLGIVLNRVKVKRAGRKDAYYLQAAANPAGRLNAAFPGEATAPPVSSASTIGANGRQKASTTPGKGLTIAASTRRR